MFEFFFNYSREVFEQGELSFAGDWPSWILFVALAVMAAVIAALLYRQRQSFRPAQLAVIGTLQLAMLVLVLGLVWKPMLRTERLRAEHLANVLNALARGEEPAGRVDCERGY